MRRKSDIYEFLKERDGLICKLCGDCLEDEWKQYEEWKQTTKKMKPRNKINLSIDHVIPRIKYKYWERGERALTNKDNLQLAHKTCNNLKGSNTPRT